MGDPAAFSASYSDFRFIKGRKVVQVVLELPLEAAGHAWNVLGGAPDPSKSAWFAIARLNPATDPSAHGVVEIGPETVKP